MSRRLLKKGRRRANRFRPYPHAAPYAACPWRNAPASFKERGGRRQQRCFPLHFSPFGNPLSGSPFQKEHTKGGKPQGDQRGGSHGAAHVTGPLSPAPLVCAAPRRPWVAATTPPLAPLRHGPQGRARWSGRHRLRRFTSSHGVGPPRTPRKIGATISPATPASLRPRSPLQKRIVSVVSTSRRRPMYAAEMSLTSIGTPPRQRPRLRRFNASPVRSACGLRGKTLRSKNKTHRHQSNPHTREDADQSGTAFHRLAASLAEFRNGTTLIQRPACSMPVHNQKTGYAPADRARKPVTLPAGHFARSRRASRTLLVRSRKRWGFGKQSFLGWRMSHING